MVFIVGICKNKDASTERGNVVPSECEKVQLPAPVVCAVQQSATSDSFWRGVFGLSVIFAMSI